MGKRRTIAAAQPIPGRIPKRMPILVPKITESIFFQEKANTIPLKTRFMWSIIVQPI
jgi:hypothetical protein